MAAPRGETSLESERAVDGPPSPRSIRGGAKDQALKALRAALHTYVPSKHIVEKRRHVYRFADQESYLVVIKGKLTEWECTLRIAELVSDSSDPAVAKRAQMDDRAAEVADEPQDRIPPGY